MTKKELQKLKKIIESVKFGQIKINKNSSQIVNIEKTESIKLKEVKK